MNNKGQVLVIFVILLPILILLLTLIVDLGLMSIEKKNISDNTKYALKYYLENIEDVDINEKTIKLLNSNVENCEITIKEKDTYIEINVEKEYNSIYSNLLNKNKLSITYKGIKENNSIIKG